MPSGSVAEPQKGGKSPAQQEDAFIRAVTRLWAWAANNTTTVVALAVALTLGVGGLFWYSSYQANLEDRASERLQSLRGRIAAGDTGTLAALETFVSRFSGTGPAMEARIDLAHQQLGRGQAARAATTVEPVLDQKGIRTPTGFAARRLLAEARAASGDTAAALELYRQLGREARFSFERRQADAERARLLADQGRLAEAVDLYRRLAASDTAVEGDSRLYGVRLGELEARLDAASGGTPEADGS